MPFFTTNELIMRIVVLLNLASVFMNKNYRTNCCYLNNELSYPSSRYDGATTYYIVQHT